MKKIKTSPVMWLVGLKPEIDQNARPVIYGETLTH